MCHSYIESATALSDNIDDEELARISGFSLAAEWDFHHIARSSNVV